MTKKPTWTLISKVHFDNQHRPHKYTECHDGPGTKEYYLFNGKYFYDWEELLKVFDDA